MLVSFPNAVVFALRPRLPKDYHYIVANPEHCGANEATSYTTRMKAHELVGVTSSAFPLYEDAYQKIMQLRDVFGKQLALDGRIERLEVSVFGIDRSHFNQGDVIIIGGSEDQGDSAQKSNSTGAAIGFRKEIEEGIVRPRLLHPIADHHLSIDN